jgi:DNA-directed RNA polymerase specialized sigma24 family protein
VWEDQEWVVQVLSSLPAGQRAVMALVVDGFTPAEIAVRLGRSPAAVRQCLMAARRRLRETVAGGVIVAAPTFRRAVADER